MVFGLSKKEHRVPDLSRYDYYYRDKEDANRNAKLSAAAAYTASQMTSGWDGTNRTQQPARAQSMTYHSGQQGNQQRKRAPGRAPSVGVMNSNRGPGTSSNYRTYSLRSQTSAQYGQGRTSSITSSNRYSRSNVPRSANSNLSGNSRANSITVKTTEVKDPQGRTKSITKRTIKRMNGYEYVETTTTTTQALPIVDANQHFDEFSGNFVMQENGLDELSEEEDIHYSAPGGRHAYSALTEQSDEQPQHGGDEQILSDGEVPLDQTSSISAFSDAMEYPVGSKNKVSRNSRRKAQNSIRVSRNGEHLAKKKNSKSAMTDQEMYNKALAIAQQKVYNNRDPSSSTSAQTSRLSTMGQRSLRTSGSVNDNTNGSSSDKSKRGSKKISEFFNKNNNTNNVNGTVPVEEVPPVQPASPQLDSTLNKGSREDEMYAKALEIAQKKYNKEHQIETATESSLKPKSKTVNESAKNTTQVQSTEEHVVEQSGPLELSTEMQEDSRNTTANGQDSQVLENLPVTNSTKTTTPEILPVQVPFPTDAATSMKKTESYERKSKLKNMFDKMKQFSAENSGYQHAKSEKEGENATSAASINKYEPAPVPPTIPTTLPATTNNTVPAINRSSFERRPVVEVDPSTDNNPEVKTQENCTKQYKKKNKKSFIKRLFGRS